MEDNFKKFGKWTAPTGLPLIGGAAYSAGKIMVGFSFSIMSLFCSFFGLPVEAKNFCDKQANAIWKDPFDGIKYGFDSTVQFSREVLHQVFPNVKADLPASAVQTPKEVELPEVKEAEADPKPKPKERDDDAGWQDQSWMQNNDKDNNGIDDDSFAAKVESGRNDNDNNHGRT